MALVVADRVQETTTTTGTGTITLAGAVAGYQSFAVIGNGNTTHYCIVSGTAWEVGIGTYTAVGTTLARTTILASSNAGAAITLAGTSTVFCTYPAGKSFNLDQVLGIADGGTGASTAATAFNALSPITSVGDLIVGDGANSATRLAIGANTTVLTSNGTTASWAAPTSSGVSSFSAGSTGLTPSTGTTGAVTLGGTLSLSNGGTGKTTAPAAQAALMGYTSTATAGGTTTLTNTSSVYQIFTGTLGQNILMPVTSTLAQGWTFHIVNNSTAAIQTQSSGSINILSVPPGVSAMLTCINTAANDASGWEAGLTDFTGATGTGNVVMATAPTITDLLLAAGTATVPPLQFTAGTNLTTAAAGVMEYDGEMLMFSPLASTRGHVPVVHSTVLITAYTLTSQTAAQKLFNTSTNGAVTLDTGLYEFECLMKLSAMSATSGTFGFAFGGTAVRNEAWLSFGIKNTLSAISTISSTFSTAANTAITGNTTSTVGMAFIKGIVRITTGGTLIPQVSLSVAAAAVVDPYSRFLIWKSNGGTNNYTTGNWS